jgi:(E)-4-hydroxy-3-methylbut-2-enyl-diphosphate synthase
MSERFRSRVVKVGDVLIGYPHPIVIQTMTTTPTCDVEATVEQILRLKDAKAQIVRLTVQGMKEVAACEKIRSRLKQLNVEIPLVADIHFFPQAAISVVDFVDKVRINPGNFVDKRAVFNQVNYSDSEYLEELKRIEEKFYPLIEKCKKFQKPIRLGVNHGSLSDRIMTRYGDSPTGMVESAFEFIAIAVKHGFYDLILSMKSSNVQVMIEAYRLLVSSMKAKNYDFPLHLGLTEAGFGLDGRIKSAIALGALLLEGIGDTIRMSLTEDPEHEIPACQNLLKILENQKLVESYRKIDTLTSKNRVMSIDRYPIFSQPQTDLEAQSSIADAIFYDRPYGGKAINFNEKNSFIGKNNIQDQKIKFRLVDQIKDFPFEGAWEEFLLIDLFSMPFDKLKENLILLKNLNYKKPIILRAFLENIDEIHVLKVATLLGNLLIDDLAEGIFLVGALPIKEIENLSLTILQSARKRNFKTEFISCPSCGRTLFDLQTVTKEIEKKTKHLPGVKIAVMGCIVNGPGEMNDADFGYVGSKPKKIDLYIGKMCVKKEIDQALAVDELIDLIKQNGKWVDP